MNTTPIIAVLVAGSALTLTACKNKVEPTTNPPAPIEQPTGNPPAPQMIEPEMTENPPAPPLPSWDDVASGHPEGATNPPIPYLYVTPEGECFKEWVSPFRAGGPDGISDRVRDDCRTEDCGAPVECPERAQALLDAYTPSPPTDGATGE